MADRGANRPEKSSCAQAVHRLCTGYAQGYAQDIEGPECWGLGAWAWGVAGFAPFCTTASLVDILLFTLLKEQKRGGVFSRVGGWVSMRA